MHGVAHEDGGLRRKVAAGADGFTDARVDALDGVGGTDDLADLHIEGQERHEFRPGVDHSFTIAGCLALQVGWNFGNRSIAASLLGTV